MFSKKLMENSIEYFGFTLNHVIEKIRTLTYQIVNSSVDAFTKDFKQSISDETKECAKAKMSRIIDIHINQLETYLVKSKLFEIKDDILLPDEENSASYDEQKDSEFDERIKIVQQKKYLCNLIRQKIAQVDEAIKCLDGIKDLLSKY